MNKSVNITYTKEAMAVIEYIKKRANSVKAERVMYDAIMRKINLIRLNPLSGKQIPKRLIPEYYKKRHNTKNLYRVELPGFWRMLYTLTEDNKVEIVAIILDIFSHKQYDEKLGYE